MSSSWGRRGLEPTRSLHCPTVLEGSTQKRKGGKDAALSSVWQGLGSQNPLCWRSLSLLRSAHFWPGKGQAAHVPITRLKLKIVFFWMPKRGKKVSPEKNRLCFHLSKKKMQRDPTGKKFSWCPIGERGHDRGRSEDRSRQTEARAERKRGGPAECSDLAGQESSPTSEAWAQGDGTLLLTALKPGGSHRSRGQQEVGAVGKLARKKKWQRLQGAEGVGTRRRALT